MPVRPLPVGEVCPVVTPASESFLLYPPEQWGPQEERQAVGSPYPQDLRLQASPQGPRLWVVPLDLSSAGSPPHRQL